MDGFSHLQSLGRRRKSRFCNSIEFSDTTGSQTTTIPLYSFEPSLISLEPASW